MRPTFGSLFAGIGGMDLGLERAGFECRWQVEIDPFCQKILTKHWPGVPKYGDIREVRGSELEPVDLIAGGFPCQDLSLAGTGGGIEAERSGLWSEYYRLVCEIRPRFVLVENVSALLIRGMGRVIGDLAEGGYDAEWDCLPCGYFSAPHFRERIFILAHSNKEHGKERVGIDANGTRQIFAGRDCESFPIWLQAANRFIGMDDGISRRFYKDRVGSIGNAVSPQVAEWIGKQLLKAISQEAACLS